jgi:hypothetical protein
LPGVHYLKYLKIDCYKVAAAFIIIFAIGLRLFLVLLHWPMTNSDEGTMALMANYVAYNGAHPLIMWGQDYMGVIEVYLGAIFYHIFGGPSITALRLSVIFIVGLFFISTYILSSLLFTKKQALIPIALLSVGSIQYLTRQTIATGGRAETLLFSSLAFLVATWLSLTYRQNAWIHTKFLRLLGYFGFGLIAGLALWSDMNVLVFLAMACLLLVIFCWREIFIWGGWLAGLIGAFIGLSPWLLYCQKYYNFSRNPLSIFYSLAHGTNNVVPYAQLGLRHSIINTIQVTIPTATGFPFCPVMEYSFLGDNTPRTLNCSIIQSTWSIGYLLLALSAITMATIFIIKILRNKSSDEIDTYELHQLLVRRTAPLIMAFAALVEIVSYTFTSGPVWQPGYHASYLIGLVAMTPALLWPLGNAASRLKPRLLWNIISIYGSRVVLVAIAIIMITGTGMAFSEVPAAQAAEVQRIDLINHLENHNITRVKTDYWTCYSLIFASKGKINCLVVQYIPGLKKGEFIQTPSHNRYSPPNSGDSPFRQIVDAAKNNISYMCAINPYYIDPQYACLTALQAMVKSSPPYRFTKYTFDGYVIYQEHPNATKNSSTTKVQASKTK